MKTKFDWEWMVPVSMAIGGYLIARFGSIELTIGIILLVVGSSVQFWITIRKALDDFIRLVKDHEDSR